MWFSRSCFCHATTLLEPVMSLFGACEMCHPFMEDQWKCRFSRRGGIEEQCLRGTAHTRTIHSLLWHFFLFLLAFCDTAKGEIFANTLWLGECKDQWKLSWSQTCLIIRFSWKGCVNNQKRISFQACNIKHHSLQAESSVVTSSPPFPLSMWELSMACFF